MCPCELSTDEAESVAHARFPILRPSINQQPESKQQKNMYKKKNVNFQCAAYIIAIRLDHIPSEWFHGCSGAGTVCMVARRHDYCQLPRLLDEPPDNIAVLPPTYFYNFGGQ